MSKAKQEKMKNVEELAKIIKSSPVIGILDLYKMPSAPLQKIKKELYGKAIIKTAKKSLVKMALLKAEKKQLENFLEGQPALLLTETNPFVLSKMLQKNKSPAAAKAGDVAKKDIVVKAGPTDIPPGPAISTLAKVKIPAKVEAGRIAVVKDHVVCKAGEKVSQEAAAALNLLKIEPMEIGLKLVAAYEKGAIYTKDVLLIDEEKTLADIAKAAQQAFNLAINSGYPTKQTISFMLMKAFMNAKALNLESKAVTVQS